MKSFLLKRGKIIITYLSVLSVIAATVTVGFTEIGCKAEALGEKPEAAVWKGPENYSDNKAIISYDSGLGTALDPFRISNGDQLYKMVTENGRDADGNPAYFRLTEDIYLNNIESDIWTNNWYSAYAAGASSFAGHFDGNCFTVYGLYSFTTEKTPVGLIPKLAVGGSVENVIVSNARLTSAQYVGALVGGLVDGDGTTAVISRCGVTESVSIKSTGKTTAAAGVIGYITKAVEIRDCYSLTSDIIGDYTGGIFGDSWGSAVRTVKNSLSVGCAPSGKDCKISENVYTDADCSFSGVTKLSANDIKGENAKENLAGFDFQNTWRTVEGSYPALRKLGVWGGSSDIDTQWKGKGTEKQPYLIYTASELYGMISVYGKADNSQAYFKLMNDIYINDVKDKNILAIENPNNWFDREINGSTKGFEGVFNGDYHTVYGLYSVTDQNYPCGLIPKTATGAVVKNLYIADSYIETNNYAGAVTGGICVNGDNSEKAVISCVGVEASVTVKSTANSASGIAGYFTVAGNISNCYSLAEIICENYGGGIYGDQWGSKTRTVENCYTVGTAPAGRDGITFSNTYTSSPCSITGVTVLPDVKMKGADAVSEMKLPEELWLTTEAYPIFKVLAQVPGDIWDGNKKNTEFAGGNGTEENPYLISDGSQLYAMVNMYKAIDGVYDSGDPGVKYFKLTKDIYLNSTESFENWANSAPANKWLEGDCWFKGHLDGNGKTVYGLYADTGTYVGFIQTLCEGGSIKNLRFKNAYVKGTGYCGVIVARTAKPTGGTGTIVDISRCSVTESVVIAGTYNAAGGIVGAAQSNDCNISNCFFADGSLSSNQVGGIVGDGWTGNKHISYCFSAGYYPVGCSKTSNLAKFSFINVSTDRDKNNTDISSTDVTVLATEQMQGDGAVKRMGFNTDIWNDTESWPQLKYSASSGSEDEKFWTVPSDTSKIGYESGTGTKTDPFIISTADQLYKMVAEHGRVEQTGAAGYFRLTNDIYLNDVSEKELLDIPENMRSGWYTAEDLSADNAFTGNFDGGGYTVYGLNAIPSKSRADGFIPVAGNGASVKNLNIRKVNIAVNSLYAGGLIGRTVSGSTVTVAYCTVRDAVIVGKFVGGIVGGAPGCTLTVSDCAFMGGNLKSTNSNALTAPNDGSVGGIIDDGWSCSVAVKDSYSVGCYPIPISKNTVNSANFQYNNIYTDTQTPYATDNLSEAQQNILLGITVLESTENIKGESAVSAMSFDWIEKWSTISGDYPMPRVVNDYYEGARGAIWSGKPALDYAGGDGTKNNPYQIETAEQLYKMVSEHCLLDDPEPGAYYELTADIYLNDTSSADWYSRDGLKQWYKTSWNGKSNYGFNGHFEGNGHFVYGIYVDETTGVSGLIPVIAGTGTVRNVHVRKAYLNGIKKSNCYLGGIAGVIQTGSSVEIGGCSVKDTVIGDAAGAGGVIGAVANASLIIDCCYFVGKINGLHDFAGGIFADSWGNVTVYSSYCAGTVMFDKATSIIADGCYGTVSQENSSGAVSVTVNPLTDEQMKGQNAEINMTEFDWDTIWYIVNDDYPHLNTVISSDGVVGGFWSGKKASAYAAGTGTKEDPYQIATGEQLYKMVVEHTVANDTEAWYVITQDIKLNDVTSANWAAKTRLKGWATVDNMNNAFCGHLDGGGHVISGLYIKSESDNIRGSLIPIIGKGATIENLGIIYSYVDVSGATKESYGAALVSYVKKWSDTAEYTLSDYPVISQCFADATVTVKGIFAGGIVCGVPSPLLIKNCYFNGSLEGLSREGGIIGNIWSSDSIVECCYSAAQGMDTFFAGSNVLTIDIKDCYVFGGINSNSNIKFLPIDNMRGETARTTMAALDFENIWLTVDGGTPVLRVFGEYAAAYSDKNSRISTVNFVTNVDGLFIPSLTGVIGSNLTLPSPVRPGYVFDGWYVYQELQCKYTENHFPFVNLTLYAKWNRNSIIQDFENYPNTSYDLDEDYEYYRPGVFGYNANNVHGGSKALHRKGQSSEEQDFLLNYEDELSVGTMYTMTFWVMSDSDDAAAEISIVNATWPDIGEPIEGISKIASFKSAKAGEWKQYTYSFTAKTRWISIRTTGSTSLYFDDFMLIPMSKGVNIPQTGDGALAPTVLICVFALGAVLLTIYAGYLLKLQALKADEEN